MYKNIVKNVDFKFLWLFMEQPSKKFHIREVAKILSINPMTARKYLLKLSKENILLQEKGKVKIINYYINTENINVKEYKKFYTIMKIINSKLLDFLNEGFLYPTVVLFGSCAKGEDFEKSDMDIFVLSETKKKIDIEPFESSINKKIELFVMNKQEFEDIKKNNKDLANNIINGVKILGFLHVI